MNKIKIMTIINSIIIIMIKKWIKILYKINNIIIKAIKNPHKLEM